MKKTILEEDNEEVSQFVEAYRKEFIAASTSKYIDFDANQLIESSPKVYELLIENPEKTIMTIESLIEDKCLSKIKVHFYNIKNVKEIHKIRGDDIGKLISVKGIIKRVTKVIPRTLDISFECPACGATITVRQFKKEPNEPARCSCGRKGKFKQISEKIIDIQEINLEEIQDDLKGKQPQQIRVYIEEELTEESYSNRLRAGRKIEVVGEIKKLPAFMNIKDEISNISEFMIHANNIVPLEQEEDDIITAEDERQIREIAAANPLEFLAKNVAPEIYGNDVVKKALVLQMVRAVPKPRTDGTMSKEDINILLSGDVGISKSRLLSSAGSRTPRAKMVVGTKTSRVGLGAMAVRDELLNTWALEIGALVLCNRTTLCLHPDSLIWCDDEVISMKEIWDKGITTRNINKKMFFKYIPSYYFTQKSGKSKIQKSFLYEAIRSSYRGKLINIKLSNGLSIKSTPDHKFYATENENIALTEVARRIFLAKELKEGYYLNSIAPPFPEKTLAEDKSYLFGFMYGDGYINQGGISISQSKKSNQQIIDKLVKDYPFFKQYDKADKTAKRISRDGTEYTSTIRETVLFSNDRNLTIEYFNKFSHLQNLLRLDEESLCKFLAGVFDSDGSINHFHSKVIALRMYPTKQEKEAQILMAALKRLGIRSIKQSFRKDIIEIAISSGSNIIKFWDKIGKYSVKLASEKSPEIKFKRNSNDKKDNFIRIEKITEEDFDDFVYDINVMHTHNFIVNGVLSHNCIDEIDKMYKEHLSELLEPMAEGKVSINKAGISAVLPARTSILAAANPIHGNYDLSQPLAKQIDLPSPILNRFDLIFIMLDKPNQEFDFNVVGHIFNSMNEKLVLDISIELFKKYITYCRKLTPQLKPELLQELQRFYVTIRQGSQVKESSEKGIPINIRNLEGLIRLAEAHAKLRLSDWVELKDLDVAKGIFMFCLKQIGIDNETGMIDTSRVYQKIPSSRRGKIEIVLSIIRELSQQTNNQTPFEDIKLRCLDKEIKQWEVWDFIEELKKMGTIFEPRKGVYSLL